MTPEEAIEILVHMPKQNTITITQKGRKAIEIGIEALKRHKHNEECFEKGVVKPLPGETEK